MNEPIEEIKLKIQLDCQDFKLYSRYYYLNSLQSKTIFSLASFCWLFIGIMQLSNIFQKVNSFELLIEYFTQNPFQILIIIFAFSLPFTLFYVYWNGFGFTKQFTTNKFAQEEQSLSISSQGLLHESSSFNGKIAWDYINKIGEDQSAFYLFISKVQAYVIPKRFFGSKEQIEAVKKIFTDNLDPNKLKLLKDN